MYIEFIELVLLKEERDSKEAEGCTSMLSLVKALLSLHHGNVKACETSRTSPLWLEM